MSKISNTNKYQKYIIETNSKEVATLEIIEQQQKQCNNNNGTQEKKMKQEKKKMKNDK